MLHNTIMISRSGARDKRTLMMKQQHCFVPTRCSCPKTRCCPQWREGTFLRAVFIGNVLSYHDILFLQTMLSRRKKHITKNNKQLSAESNATSTCTDLGLHLKLIMNRWLDFSRNTANSLQ